MTGNRTTLLISFLIFGINILIEKNKYIKRKNIIFAMIIVILMSAIIPLNPTLRERMFQKLNKSENYSLYYRSTSLVKNLQNLFFIILKISGLDLDIIQYFQQIIQ